MRHLLVYLNFQLKLVADETPTSVKIVKRVRSAGIPENVSLASENKAVLPEDRMSPPNIADTHPSLLDLSDLGETERAPRLLSPNPSRTDVYGNLLGPSKKPIPKFRTSLLGNRSATEALNLTHNYGEIQFAEKPKLTAQQQFAKISVEKICNPRPHVIPAKEVYGFTDSASEPVC
uniref:Uncharacterized protein n=1 Tax=Panagrolaimus superbus TaxID=310955 RepID=A0A914YMQ3_9BILA